MRVLLSGFVAMTVAVLIGFICLLGIYDKIVISSLVFWCSILLILVAGGNLIYEIGKEDDER